MMTFNTIVNGHVCMDSDESGQYTKYHNRVTSCN